jgi:DNA polymerase III epsilon subunit family exonuclease
MDLAKAKLAFLDVETTGLSPAMGDRIVEVGIVVCQGEREIDRVTGLVNPERPMPLDAYQVHGIADRDLADCPTFGSLAADVRAALDSAWIIGHNVRFDVGFVAMEIAAVGQRVRPLGCLDTCQLAPAVWDLPNYQLETVVTSLRIPVVRQHRALDDALLTRAVFTRVVEELGGWHTVRLADLQALHSYLPSWPEDPRGSLPDGLYDALTNGRELAIRYVNGSGQESARTIRPLACFPAGRYTYVRAHCSQAGEIRTFRVDRIVWT